MRGRCNWQWCLEKVVHSKEDPHQQCRMGDGTQEPGTGLREKRQGRLDIGQALASKTAPIQMGTRGQNENEAILRDTWTCTCRIILRTAHGRKVRQLSR